MEQNREWQGKPIDEEVKVKIAARLIAGDKPADIIKDFDVSPATVSRIKTKYLNEEILAKMSEERTTILHDLMLHNMEVSLNAQINIASQTTDQAWLKSQSAGDLGKMYGIMSDKLVRTVEALEAARLHEGDSNNKPDLTSDVEQ